MHLVRADGRVVAGYDAVRTLCVWTPLFWPFGLLGALPGIPWLGRRVYNAVAASRPRDVPCTEYSPSTVKQAVCGYGRADKAQVQRMVKAILGLAEEPTPSHAADALAVAICHALAPPLLRVVNG